MDPHPSSLQETQERKALLEPEASYFKQLAEAPKIELGPRRPVVDAHTALTGQHGPSIQTTVTNLISLRRKLTARGNSKKEEDQDIRKALQERLAEQTLEDIRDFAKQMKKFKFLIEEILEEKNTSRRANTATIERCIAAYFEERNASIL